VSAMEAVIWDLVNAFAIMQRGVIGKPGICKGKMTANRRSAYSGTATCSTGLALRWSIKAGLSPVSKPTAAPAPHGQRRQ